MKDVLPITRGRLNNWALFLLIRRYSARDKFFNLRDILYEYISTETNLLSSHSSEEKDYEFIPLDIFLNKKTLNITLNIKRRKKKQ